MHMDILKGLSCKGADLLEGSSSVDKIELEELSGVDREVDESKGFA